MEDFVNDIVESVQQKISDSANKIVGDAMNNIAKKYLPSDSEKQNFLARMNEIKADGIEAFINGEDYEKYLNRGAYETSVFLANHYAKAALTRAKQEFPRGKTRDAVFAAFDEMTRKGIEVFCSGESLEVIKKQLTNIGKDHLKKYIESQSRIWSKNIGNNLYRKIKFNGRGSRKKNQYLREGRDILADELAFQITDNLGAWLGGEKDFGEAMKDLTFNTAKNSVVNYTKKQGAEIVSEAVKELAKKAEKEIGKGVVSNILGKLANANTLMNVAGAVYDVGKAFKQLIDGEISKTEFLQIVGEKGIAVVISSYTALIGEAIGGPIGAAIGGAIGSAMSYFASSFIFNSLIQASREAEISRQRYEAIHAYCEYSIREMERQRLEFESKVKEFLGARQAVIDSSLDDYERALKNNDFDSANNALISIQKEFGGKPQWNKFEEFDEFMSDKNSVFEF